jgi:ABC transporter DrrB family efflux protein
MTAVSLPAPARRRTLQTIVRDSAVHTWRNLIHLAREPLRLSDVTIQPVLFTLLFVYVFGAGVSIPGPPAHGSYTQFAIAGLLGLNLTTGAIGTAVGLSTDLATGVIDRFRTLPQWPAAVLVGRSIADVMTAAICIAIVMAVGLVVGWRPGGTALETAGAVGVMLLFAYAISWVCACIGIASKDAESAQNLGLIVLFPLSFVSNALVPTAHMPAVLRAIADYNPVSAVTAAARQLLHNPNPSASIGAWPMQHPVLASLIWSVGLIAIAAPIATRLYRRRTSD